MMTMNSRFVALLSWITVATLGAGCGPDCASITGELAITLGAGDASNPTQFTALSDGATVPLARGNQGGQHVWVLVRAMNACPLPPRVRAIVRAEDGRNLGFAISEGIPWTAAPSMALATEPLAVPIQFEDLCLVYYRGATLEVTVTDSTGRTAQRAVRIGSITLSGFSPDIACRSWQSDGGTNASDASMPLDVIDE
jgi:hypothetical protein